MRGLLGRSQALSSQCQNGPRGVEIAVEDQPTTGAGVGAVSEGERLPMSTARAILRRVCGVHRDKAPTGPCCLVGEKCGELGPRCVMDAVGATLVVRHPVEREVRNGDQSNGVDDAATV